MRKRSPSWIASRLYNQMRKDWRGRYDEAEEGDRRGLNAPMSSEAEPQTVSGSTDTPTTLLGLWGAVDILALALMAWALVNPKLLSFEDGKFTLNVGIFEQCNNTVGGEECQTAGSNVPEWQWATALFAFSSFFSFLALFSITAALMQSRTTESLVWLLRFVVGTRNACNLAAWVLIPVGFARLGDKCGGKSDIHCGVTRSSLLDSSATLSYGMFVLPDQWTEESGTWALFFAVMLHFVSSGIGAYLLTQPKDPAFTDPVPALSSRDSGGSLVANLGYPARYTPLAYSPEPRRGGEGGFDAAEGWAPVTQRAPPQRI